MQSNFYLLFKYFKRRLDNFSKNQDIQDIIFDFKTV